MELREILIKYVIDTSIAAFRNPDGDLIKRRTLRVERRVDEWLAKNPNIFVDPKLFYNQAVPTFKKINKSRPNNLPKMVDQRWFNNDEFRITSVRSFGGGLVINDINAALLNTAGYTILSVRKKGVNKPVSINSHIETKMYPEVIVTNIELTESGIVLFFKHLNGNQTPHDRVLLKNATIL